MPAEIRRSRTIRGLYNRLTHWAPRDSGRSATVGLRGQDAYPSVCLSLHLSLSLCLSSSLSCSRPPCLHSYIVMAGKARHAAARVSSHRIQLLWPRILKVMSGISGYECDQHPLIHQRTAVLGFEAPLVAALYVIIYSFIYN